MYPHDKSTRLLWRRLHDGTEFARLVSRQKTRQTCGMLRFEGAFRVQPGSSWIRLVQVLTARRWLIFLQDDESFHIFDWCIVTCWSPGEGEEKSEVEIFNTLQSQQQDRNKGCHAILSWKVCLFNSSGLDPAWGWIRQASVAQQAQM